MEARPLVDVPAGRRTRPRFVPGRALRKALIAGVAVMAVVALVLSAIGFGGQAFAYSGLLDAIGLGGGQPGTSAYTGLPPATFEVTEGTLKQTQSVNGILSHGEPVPLISQSTSGVLTWIAPAGSVVKLGEPVYTVNGLPVVLIHGTIPPYRTLEQGVVGPDVQQLEASLLALGYPILTVDETFDYATVEAVWAWQSALGLVPTGYVTPDQIAVADGDIRVALPGLAVGTHLADGANQTILTYSGTERYVSIPLDVFLQHLVAVGNAATVTLPDGTQVAGKVSFVDSVAQDIEEKQIIGVHVSIKNKKALGNLDAAPVTVTLETGERADVLIVPVNALVALAGGGYGLEVVGNGQTSYVAVETGMFANGMVEVSGPGIEVGTVVGVAE